MEGYINYAVLPPACLLFFFGIQFSPCLFPGLDLFWVVWIVCGIDKPPLSSTLLSCSRSAEPFFHPSSSLLSFYRQVFFVHPLQTSNYYTAFCHSPHRIKTRIETEHPPPPILIGIERERTEEKKKMPTLYGTTSTKSLTTALAVGGVFLFLFIVGLGVMLWYYLRAKPDSQIDALYPRDVESVRTFIPSSTNAIACMFSSLLAVR